jgi:hypothetical protein
MLGALIAFAAVALAILIPDSYECAGLNVPEGRPCQLERISVDEYGDSVFIVADERLPLRLTIAIVGILASFALLWYSSTSLPRQKLGPSRPGGNPPGT